MSDEVEIIDLSDGENCDDDGAPPPKKACKRIALQTTKIEIEECDGDGAPVESPKLDNGFNHPNENGVPPVSTQKKTARKRMSSFTPKLNPTETIILDADEEPKPSGSHHPQYEEVNDKIKQFLKEILGCVNSVEHATIQKKMGKRLTWIDQLTPKTKLKILVENLQLLTEKVIRKPLGVWEIIKEILEEFERYKPGAVAKPGNGSVSTESSNDDKYKEQKRRSHVKKLHKALRQCNREILKLEEAECDLDDEEAWGDNSVYIRISKYKKRLITLQKKINNLEGMKTSFGRACDKKFKTEASRIPEVNQKIQDVVNKERRFPDYHDVMKIYKSVCEEKKLDYSKQELSHKARETFVEVGRNLKNRRYRDDMDVMESYIPADKNEEEPPEKDSVELRSILEQNDKTAKERLDNVINGFAEKSEVQKETAQEVADDAPESSKEEDDGEEDDNEEEDDKDELVELNEHDEDEQDEEDDNEELDDKDDLVELNEEDVDPDNDLEDGQESDHIVQFNGQETDHEEKNDKESIQDDTTEDED